MTRIVTVLFLLLSTYAGASESCKVIHGRAHHATDGGPRIWAFGTHHEYEAADVASAERIDKWLGGGPSKADWEKAAAPLSYVYLYADFLVCPTEPFRKGAVQLAKIKSANHMRYTRFRPLD